MALKLSTKRFVLSDETRNLYGFITKTAGIDLTAFNENPVMLYNHDYSKLIGQWEDIRIEGTKLTASPAFDEADDEAMQYYSKVEQGILKGASIGISPQKFDDKKSEMTSSLLLECSLTPVPNNRKALAVYNAKGDKLSAKDINMYLLTVERETETKTNQKKMNEKAIALLIALCAQAGHVISLTAESTNEEIDAATKKITEYVGGLKTKTTELSAKIMQLEMEKATAADKQIDDLLREAVEQKRLTAEKVAAMKEFGKVNLQAMKDLLGVTTAVNLVAIPSAAEQQVAAGEEAWTFDDYAEKKPSELSAMEFTNPQRFQKLLSAKIAEAKQKHLEIA